MSTDTLLQQAGLGFISTPPTVSTSDVLGTTPLKVVLPDLSLPQNQRAQKFSILITNPNATALVSWMTVVRGSAAPTFASTYVAATPSGAPILPGTSTSIIIPAGHELYVVSDTASSKYAAVIEMY